MIFGQMCVVETLVTSSVNTHGSDVEIIQNWHLEPFLEVVFAYTWFCLKDRQWNGPGDNKTYTVLFHILPAKAL